MRNATFKGTDEFKGMKVDVWIDKVCDYRFLHFFNVDLSYS